MNAQPEQSLKLAQDGMGSVELGTGRKFLIAIRGYDDTDVLVVAVKKLVRVS